MNGKFTRLYPYYNLKIEHQVSFFQHVHQTIKVLSDPVMHRSSGYEGSMFIRVPSDFSIYFLVIFFSPKVRHTCAFLAMNAYNVT